MLEEMKREQIEVPNGNSAIPKNNSPLNGQPAPRSPCWKPSVWNEEAR
jgi:hypothetical protein